MGARGRVASRLGSENQQQQQRWRPALALGSERWPHRNAKVPRAGDIFQNRTHRNARVFSAPWKRFRSFQVAEKGFMGEQCSMSYSQARISAAFSVPDSADWYLPPFSSLGIILGCKRQRKMLAKLCGVHPIEVDVGIWIHSFLFLPHFVLRPTDYLCQLSEVILLCGMGTEWCFQGTWQCTGPRACSKGQGEHTNTRASLDTLFLCSALLRN